MNDGSRATGAPAAGRLAAVAVACALALFAGGGRSAAASEVAAGERTLRHDGVARTYTLHVPDSYAAKTPSPLVLVFHGGFGSGARVAGRIGMNAIADRHGFVVAYPDGLDRHWNDGRAAMADGADDVGFVAALIAAIRDELAIDAARIYATGLSNGGYFTHRLACEMADGIAAFAPVIASLPAGLADRCAPARPVPMLLIAGTEDPFVPWGGGALSRSEELGGGGGDILSLPEAAAFWAGNAGCDPTPDETRLADTDPDDGTRIKRIAFTGCRAEVVLLAVEGGGHTWPGAPERWLIKPIVGATSRDIDASAVIWRFFSDHALPRGGGSGS